MMKRWFYDLVYGNSFVPIPWDSGPRRALVDLVESGRVQPCRVIDLGCGTASNVVYLAQKGFSATGIDFSPAAIKLGREKARQAGVAVDLIVDDLTNLRHVKGPYDFLIDFGVLDDLGLKDRALYMRNVLPLTRPGSLFLFFCFEWPPRWWERLFFNNMAIAPGEVEERFGAYFEIELLSREETGSIVMPRFATYLMTRNEREFQQTF